MSIEYLMSICNSASPKDLAYQIGLSVHKGQGEDEIWMALEPILDHPKMAQVIARLGSVRRSDAEEEAELGLTTIGHPLTDLSPRLHILLLRALLRRYRYEDDQSSVVLFVERLRSFWKEDAAVIRLMEIADTLVDIPFGRLSAEWEGLLESYPPIECHRPYLDQAAIWAHAAPSWTDEQIYRFIRSSVAHCTECEEIALASVGEERMDPIAERIWQAQLADEMVEGVFRGF